MEEQNKTEPVDFSEKFLPHWRNFRRCQNGLIVLFFIFFACELLKAAFAKIIIWIFVILAIVSNVYFYFKLRCPGCDNPLLGIFIRSTLFIGRNCPSCGAILKKKGIDYPIHPWIPWDEKTNREKTIIVAILTAMVMLMVLAIVVGIIKGGGIQYHHFDVPKSQCR